MGAINYVGKQWHYARNSRVIIQLFQKQGQMEEPVQRLAEVLSR